jgi:hypothetical protein
MDWKFIEYLPVRTPPDSHAYIFYYNKFLGDFEINKNVKDTTSLQIQSQLIK